MARNRILRLGEVLEVAGISKSTLYRRIAEGEFPRPVKLGGPGSRAVGWLEVDVFEWIDQLKQQC